MELWSDLSSDSYVFVNGVASLSHVSLQHYDEHKGLFSYELCKNLPDHALRRVCTNLAHGAMASAPWGSP